VTSIILYNCIAKKEMRDVIRLQDREENNTYRADNTPVAADSA
jgi:hypothetical protein